MSKGKGWYGDRHRHRLASMGIKTTLNPSLVRFRGGEFYEADGVIYTPRKDFVNRVEGQLRCLKAYGIEDDEVFGNLDEDEAVYGMDETEKTDKDEAVYGMDDEIKKDEEHVPLPPIEEHVPPPLSQETDLTWNADEKLVEAKEEEAYKKDRLKHAEEMTKIAEKKEEALEKGIEKDAKQKMRDEQVKAGVGVGGAKDLVTKAGKSIWEGVKKFFTASPSDISRKKPVGGKGSPLGNIKSNRISDTAKAKTPADYNNVSKDTYKSVDADSMIATIENKEKLIGFANDLEYDIDRMEVSLKKHQREFQTEERKDAKLFMIDYRKAKSELRDEIDLIKTTGQKESAIKSEVGNIKVVFEFNMNKLKNALKTQKMQHRADLKHIDDLKDDFSKLHKQTDKRLQQMVASGVRK